MVQSNDMSAVCILAPVVITAWPAFSAAVVAAAGSLGYVVAVESVPSAQGSEQRRVDLEIPQSQLVTGELGRDQRLSVTRDGVQVTFSRDVRGRAAVCVTGSGCADEELRRAGEELSARVVQTYVYRRLMDEIQARQFVIVEEMTDENNAVHLKVRHWEAA